MCLSTFTFDTNICPLTVPMDKANIQAIVNQTGVTDELEVRRVYFANKKDVTATIVQLLSLSEVPRKTTASHTSEFNDIRNILDTKAVHFQQYMQSMKQAQEIEQSKVYRKVNKSDLKLT